MNTNIKKSRFKIRNNGLTKKQKEFGRVLVPDIGIDFDDKQKHFLSAIRFRQIFCFDKDKFAFVSINAKSLENIIGRYRDTVQSLVSLNIVIPDNQYVPGVTSKAYKFADKFKFKVDYIKTDFILENRKRYKEKFMPKIHYIKFLYKNLLKIEVDVQKGMDIISNGIAYDKIIEDKHKHKRTKSGKKKSYFTKEEYQNLYQDSITLLSLHDFYFHVDNTAGRVHSNISSLKRELRSSLFYKSKPLYELDCANSQNFLFNVFIKKFFAENTVNDIFQVLFQNQEGSKPRFSSVFHHLLSVINIFKDNINSILSYDRPKFDNCHNNNTVNSVFLYDNLYPELNDILKYFHLTCSGNYWNFLMQKDNFNGDKATYKQTSFANVFFCKIPTYRYKPKERKTFERHFPNVIKIIDFYKRHNYKDLSINMQKEEVDIIIHTIIKRIYSEHPKMFVLTNHDAIYCTKENVNYINNVMLEEYHKKYNFTPTIKISPHFE